MSVPRALARCRASVWRLVATAALLLAGAAGAARAGTVLLAVAPNIGSLPIYVAEERGLFAAEGVQVRRVECSFGRECLRLMLDDKAQLATVADLPLVMAAFARERFLVLATINTNRNDTKLVARRDGGIRALADLGGKRIGTPMGTTAQYAFESQLLFAGVDPARLQMVDLPPAAMRNALLARQVDAIAVFEPWAFDAEQALGADAVVFGTERAYTQTWNLVGLPAPRGAAAADTEAVLRALLRAARWIASEPRAARQTLARRLNLGAELVDASWPQLGYEPSLKQSLLTTMEGQARWARRGGRVAGPTPDFLDHIDVAPLRRLQPGSATLVK